MRRKLRKQVKKMGIIPAIEKGIIGYHVWKKIKKVNGKYTIEIDSNFIKKGYLVENELYCVVFRFAKYECPCHEGYEKVKKIKRRK